MFLPELTPEQILAIIPFIFIGFFAQIIDGALGMAFGVITNTLLVSVLGMPPARASASVHLVETFTTGASGLSHILHGNVDWKLFRRLAIPGIIGGVIGAYVLSNVDGKAARPFVMTYLFLMGFYLLWKAFKLSKPAQSRPAKIVAPLGLIGGFMDAAGGGGWGPIVTSNLLAQGTEPRTTIGTVNAAEFLLTLTISITFIATIGFSAFSIVAVGLIIGGLLAAPLGAILAKRISAQKLLFAVAAILILTSAFSLYRVLTAV